jgi:hypothetical protein
LMRQAYTNQDEVKRKGAAALESSVDYGIVPVGKKLAQVMFE